MTILTSWETLRGRNVSFYRAGNAEERNYALRIFVFSCRLHPSAITRLLTRVPGNGCNSAWFHVAALRRKHQQKNQSPSRHLFQYAPFKTRRNDCLNQTDTLPASRISPKWQSERRTIDIRRILCQLNQARHGESSMLRHLYLLFSILILPLIVQLWPISTASASSCVHILKSDRGKLSRCIDELNKEVERNRAEIDALRTQSNLLSKQLCMVAIEQHRSNPNSDSLAHIIENICPRSKNPIRSKGNQISY